MTHGKDFFIEVNYYGSNQEECPGTPTFMNIANNTLYMRTENGCHELGIDIYYNSNFIP